MVCYWSPKFSHRTHVHRISIILYLFGGGGGGERSTGSFIIIWMKCSCWTSFSRSCVMSVQISSTFVPCIDSDDTFLRDRHTKQKKYSHLQLNFLFKRWEKKMSTLGYKPTTLCLTFKAHNLRTTWNVCLALLRFPHNVSCPNSKLKVWKMYHNYYSKLVMYSCYRVFFLIQKQADCSKYGLVAIAGVYSLRITWYPQRHKKVRKTFE